MDRAIPTTARSAPRRQYLRQHFPDSQPPAFPGGAGPAGRPIPTDPAAMLVTAEAAHLLCLSVRTLEALRLRGGGPAFVAVATRAIRYQRADLDAWIAARRRQGNGAA